MIIAIAIIYFKNIALWYLDDNLVIKVSYKLINSYNKYSFIRKFNKIYGINCINIIYFNINMFNDIKIEFKKYSLIKEVNFKYIFS